MKFALLILALFGYSSALGECLHHQITIAVIDTGFGFQGRGKDAKLCNSGHTDFSREDRFSYMGTNSLIPTDTDGHGTNIVGLIDKYAKDSKVDYCIYILKYYSKNNSGIQNLYNSTSAIRYAADLHVDFINYSGGGNEPSEIEKKQVKRFLDQGGQFIAAAGNDGRELGTFLGINYYPAMYDKRIVVVGNKDSFGTRIKSSNYGKLVNRWEIGENQEAYGITLTGTSQATAVATGKLIGENKNKCILKKYVAQKTK